MTTPAVLVDQYITIREVVTSIVTDEYTLTPEDEGYWLRTLSDDPVSFTIPPQEDAAFIAYTSLTVEQAGDGAVTFVAGDGVTINSALDLTTDAQFTVVRLKRVAEDEWTLAALTNEPPRVLPVLYVYASGLFLESEVLWRQRIDQEFLLAANFDGWIAELETAPTSSLVIDVRVNAGSIGTITFAGGATTGTFSTTAAQDLNTKLLRLVAPATADATAAGLNVTGPGI